MQVMNARVCSTPPKPNSRAEQLSMAQLVQQVAVLNQTAFGVLYDAMFTHVRAQALAALSSAHAVDAVVAATFLQIWWLAPLYNPSDADATAWISQIAAERIADRQRDAAPTQSPTDVDAMPRTPWSGLSGAYDETVAVVLAGLLGRRGTQKAF